MLVAMDDRFGATLCQRHLERIEHQRGAQVIGHRPTHHTAGPHVQHDGQVQKPRPGRHVGDVGDSESIRTLGAEAPADLVQRAVGLGVRDGRGDELRRRPPLQSGRPHEPRHALASDPDSVIVGQLRVDARRTVRATRTPVDRVVTAEVILPIGRKNSSFSRVS